MSFFVAAYLVLWVGIFAYLMWIAARLRALREETRALAADGEPGPGGEIRRPAPH